MNFASSQKSIENVLHSGKIFKIPRFQREYSWGNYEIREFLTDILENIMYDSSGTLRSSDYFMGTMLFIGNFEKVEMKEFIVVDGQQRLTTITILLSAISKLIQEAGNVDLSDQVFKYVMNFDRNGDKFRILINESPNPFFAYYVQENRLTNALPSSEEEARVKGAFDYFYTNLSKARVRSLLKKYNNGQSMAKIDYVEMLKVVRDQVLNSYVIAITSEEENSANRIFEILNAKGLELSTVDLIKNNIFEVLNEEEPLDRAKILWTDTVRNLLKNNTRLSMSLYFRHYWNSKFGEASDNSLFNKFLSKVRPQNEKKYIEFLEELEKESTIYNHIVNPQNLAIYNNDSELLTVNQSLKAISSVFNVIQARVLILSLHYARFQTRTIKQRQFIGVISKLEDFHFAFNVMASLRPSSIGKRYNKLARFLRDETNNHKVKNELETFIKDLKKLMPSYDDFRKGFTSITYSNKYDDSKNEIAVYVLNKIENKLSSRNINRTPQSVEHIIPESSGEGYTMLGNLSLLEPTINNDAGNKPYKQKTIHYGATEFSTIKKLCLNYPSDFDLDKIKERTEALCKFYYENILGLTIFKK